MLPYSTATGLTPLQRTDNRKAVQERQRPDTPGARAMICSGLQRVMPDDFPIDTVQDKIADGHQGASTVNVLATAKVPRIQCVERYQETSATASRVIDRHAGACKLAAALHPNHQIHDVRRCEELTGARFAALRRDIRLIKQAEWIIPVTGILKPALHQEHDLPEKLEEPAADIRHSIMPAGFPRTFEAEE